jgi:hypothetical protein
MNSLVDHLDPKVQSINHRASPPPPRPAFPSCTGSALLPRAPYSSPAVRAYLANYCIDGEASLYEKCLKDEDDTND